MTENSALHWFPPLVEAGLPVPRTVVVEFEPGDLFAIVDGKPPSDAYPVDTMVAAVKEVGTPCFLRTDLSSAKHDGPSTYRIDAATKDVVCWAAARTFEENVMKMMFEMPLAFMFREWLDLAYYFTAFRGHRIAREWRYFVEDSKITDRYFYWPWHAVEDHLDPNPIIDPQKAYELSLDLSRELTTEERTPLNAMAVEAARAVGGGDWSVDFAQDKNGRWWLIDMALAASSWRPSKTSKPKSEPPDVGSYLRPKD
jgi:hypothetical protein